MSAGVLNRTLPLRRWLALALVISFVVPFGLTGFIAFHLIGDVPQQKVNQSEDRLRADIAQWNDPAWQQAIAADLKQDGIDILLVRNTSEIFESTPNILATTGESGRVVHRLAVQNGNDLYSAYLYSDAETGPPAEIRNWGVPIVAVTTLICTLGGIAWFLGRMVVKPLAATSEAARQIAAGNLDVAVPTSRVREVADVNLAFDDMSAELRASLQHQSELEQERRLFIGAIAHDLRTPLFSLRGSLEGLATGVANSPEKQARYIAVAQEKAGALERLISDLFDYTRLEYLDQTPNREPVDLGSLLSRLVEGARSRAEAKGLALTFIAPDQPCMIEGDPHLLTRAIENLLDNALRYTPSGGSVQAECHRENGQIRFSIADTGPGIPEADLPHIFTPLFRGEGSRNRRTGGAGLGLTIAQKIIVAHGGTLTAANRPEGGAVLMGTLPEA
jgi:signal transduction histidine kinase